MKLLILSLLALTNIDICAAESTNAKEATAPSKVYYRCESRGFEFDDSSLMKEVAPGRYTLTVAATDKNIKDKCVVSVVDSEDGADELCFVDYFPNLAPREGVVMEKSYSLRSAANRSTFDVDYKSADSHIVIFDNINFNLLVKLSNLSQLAVNK